MRSHCGKTSLVTWLGKIGTGSSGDVKKIRKAIESLLKENQEKINIIFDCQDLGVAVFENTSKKILFKHSYMQISSCGCTVNRPNHFAYIAEEPNEEQPEECFMCYIFYSPDTEKVDTLLNSIGQGFKRTHCAV
uniref:PID domain-containing protein n=1 Tax=Clastoptera arizonana TaxID=38151 RepID=A0A1B6E8N3_9HEMI